MTRRILTLVLLAACSSCSSSSDALPPVVGEVAEAATTPGHQAASLYASQHSCAQAYVGDGTAQVWGVDPDCAPSADNPIGDCWAHWPPDPPEGIFNGSLSWGCYNWTHFSNNGFGLETNSIDQNAMQFEATQAAFNARVTGDIGQRNLAIRRGFDACHFSVDRNQCGHAFGNMVCDPHAASPSQACIDFYTQFSSIPFGLGMTPTTVIYDGCLLASGSTANAYAAAERYVRHHNPGYVLDNPAWVNNCPATCPSGDSNGWEGDSCQIGGFASNDSICLDDVARVCAQLCTPRTCTELGVTCTTASDGCGGTLSCGQCQPGATCVNGNQCIGGDGCTAQKPECGPYEDSCGNPLDAGN